MALLEVSNLRVGFSRRDGIAEAIRGIDLSIDHGEAVGLVGESGSGKSLTALAILRLLDRHARVVDGRILFNGNDLLALTERDLRRIRGAQISMIFQDPLTSLNPAFTIGRQLTDVIQTHQGLSLREARTRAIDVLSLVDIPSPAARLRSYPHQFSGGMRQRVLIAMAIACRPQLLIADEPTTALDVTVQAQVISLLRRVRDELKLAVLFITHNLDLVAELCDRVVVMYAGRIMEEAPVEQLFTTPRHPYTRALMACVPRLDQVRHGFETIDGSPPGIESVIPGCVFEPRCPLAMDRCRSERPAIRLIDRHRVACWAVSE